MRYPAALGRAPSYPESWEKQEPRPSLGCEECSIFCIFLGTPVYSTATMEGLSSIHRPCPFCGSYTVAAESSGDLVDDTILHAIWCQTCEAGGPFVVGGPDHAWGAWNLRTDIPQHWLDPVRRGTSHPLPEDEFLRQLARPCPFCGNRVLKCDTTEGIPSCISCLTCEASECGRSPGTVAAIEAWNSRPDIPAGQRPHELD
jgi:hypothetical protein